MLPLEEQLLERCSRSEGRTGKVLNSCSSQFWLSYGTWSLLPPLLFSHVSFINGRKAQGHVRWPQLCRTTVQTFSISKFLNKDQKNGNKVL